MARNVSINAPRQYTRSYSGFRGVELGVGSEGASRHRLAYVENMYRDYGGNEPDIIESVPGYRRIAEFRGKIHGIYEQKIADGRDCLLIHAGTGLYRMQISSRDSYTPGEPIVTLPNSRICFFSCGTEVWALTGTDVIRIDEHGTALSVTEHPELPYAPIIALNGKPHEQRNLLTDRFREEYVIEDPASYTRGSSALMYIILDSELLTCAVAGINPTSERDIYIPATAKLLGKKYRVTEIRDRAFSDNTEISSIEIADGVEKIGYKAFSGCSLLEKAIVPESVSEIGEMSFNECSLLKELYLGRGITKIGANAFAGCASLKTVNYGGNRDMLSAITGSEQLSSHEKVFNSSYQTCALRIPLTEAVESVISVKENGVELEFECNISGTNVSAVLIRSSSAGKKSTDILIEGTLRPLKKKFGTGTSVSAFSAIASCGVAEIFDGRIFLAGAPTLPNTVFYSALSHSEADSSLYFGADNYFNDGIGAGRQSH